MNYTADTSDTEHLAGPSPWGSSSPKEDRTSFPTSSSDSPPSPIPAPQQSPYLDPHSSPTISRYHDVPDRPHLHTTSTPATGYDAETLAGPHQPHTVPPGSAGVGEQPQSQQPQYTGQQQRQSAARYQATRPQRNVPQYKLQAKVTALERSGRKDPVLRFDVYVWWFYFQHANVMLSVLADQFTKVSHHAVPRRPPHTFRIH